MTKEIDRLLQTKLHDLGFDVIEKHIFSAPTKPKLTVHPEKKQFAHGNFLNNGSMNLI